MNTTQDERLQPVPLARFQVLLLDMHSTFMFGEDRFGADEDFAATYVRCGGDVLSPDDIERHIRAAHAFLTERYGDPTFEDDFPSLAEALQAVAPELPAAERDRLVTVFGHHECGTVPADFSAALADLHRTHELRLISNIWAPREPWLAELQRAGVLHLFERLIFSSDGRSLKPSRRLFQQALGELRCPFGEVLMIGDSFRCDMFGAKRVGLKTLWVSPQSRTLDPESALWVDYQCPSVPSLVAGSRGQSR